MKDWKYGDVYRLKNSLYNLTLMVICDSLVYSYCPTLVVINGNGRGNSIGCIADWDVTGAAPMEFPPKRPAAKGWVKVEDE